MSRRCFHTRSTSPHIVSVLHNVHGRSPSRLDTAAPVSRYSRQYRAMHPVLRIADRSLCGSSLFRRELPMLVTILLLLMLSYSIPFSVYEAASLLLASTECVLAVYGMWSLLAESLFWRYKGQAKSATAHEETNSCWHAVRRSKRWTQFPLPMS